MLWLPAPSPGCFRPKARAPACSPSLERRSPTCRWALTVRGVTQASRSPNPVEAYRERTHLVLNSYSRKRDAKGGRGGGGKDGGMEGRRANVGQNPPPPHVYKPGLGVNLQWVFPAGLNSCLPFGRIWEAMVPITSGGLFNVSGIRAHNESRSPTPTHPPPPAVCFLLP